MPRVRGKLSNVTGTHLGQTTLHEPSATPSAGGVPPAVAEPGAGTVPGVAPIPGGLFGGSVPLPPPPSFGGAPAVGGTGITSVVPVAATTLTSNANSPLNLLGTIEGWGIGGQTKVRVLRLSTEGLNGAQLQALLRKLPEGKYVLEVQKEEGV